jgi:hypothetical protein
MMAANELPVVPDGDTPALPQAELPVMTEPEAEAAVKKRGGGVRTPEGKEISKRNSLDCGLWALKVFPKSLEADIEQCTAELMAQFQPRTPYAARLVREMGRATAQLELAELHVLVEQQRLMDRAQTSWDRDRSRAVEEQLVKKLPQEPERLIGLLKDTKQGAEWILKNWARLAEALETNGGWDEIQRSQAYDLLGVPLMFRNSTRAIPPADDLEGLKALVAHEQEALRRSLEDDLIASDEADRRMAASGMGRDDAELKRVRRAAAWARRSRDKARNELLRVQAGTAAVPCVPPPPQRFGPPPSLKPAAPVALPVVPPDSTIPAPPKATDEARALRLERSLAGFGPPSVTALISAPVAKPTVPPPAPAPAMAPPPAAPPPVKPLTDPLAQVREERRRDAEERRERQKREREARKASRRRHK